MDDNNTEDIDLLKPMDSEELAEYFRTLFGESKEEIVDSDFSIFDEG